LKAYTKRIIWFFIIILSIVALDIVTKVLVGNITKTLNAGESISVIDGIFSFVHVHNYGAAFGILQDSRIFFIVMTIIMFAVLIIIETKLKINNLWYKSAFVLIFSGALGNFIDRVFMTGGYVRDFIKLDFVNFAYFNIADSALTIGTICAFIYVLFYYSNSGVKK
jgi:signal peptidase II